MLFNHRCWKDEYAKKISYQYRELKYDVAHLCRIYRLPKWIVIAVLNETCHDYELREDAKPKKVIRGHWTQPSNFERSNHERNN